MWKTVYDSVQGAAHLRSGTPCQDACRVICEDQHGKGLLLIACADGAGSAEHADIGSTIACDEFVKLVQAHNTGQHILESLTRDTVIDWLHRVRIAIENRASELRVTVRELATTLLIALIGDDSAVFLQIGDGAILIRKDQDFCCVFWPQSGEYANTTNFLTDSAFEEHLEFISIPDRINECVVFTDGLERLILHFEGKTVHRPFIEPMLQKMRSTEVADSFFQPLRTFLGSDAVNERTDDDKTLVLATRLSVGEDESLL